MTATPSLPHAYECSTCGEVFRPGVRYRAWWDIDRCAPCATANTRDAFGRYQSTTARERDSHAQTRRPTPAHQSQQEASPPQAARSQQASEATQAEVTGD